jgi:DNA repair protein RadC
MVTLKVKRVGKPEIGKVVSDHQAVYNNMRFLAKEDRENFFILHLDAKNCIIAKELIFIGTLTESLIHPREVFKGAILNNAASIIAVHNHPSGNIQPSGPDIRITRLLKDAGDLIGIKLRDHVIIGSEGATSIFIYLNWL